MANTYYEQKDDWNCPESYDDFMDSYFFNRRKCILEFFRTVTSKTILKKKGTIQFVNIKLIFLLAACANSLN